MGSGGTGTRLRDHGCRRQYCESSRRKARATGFRSDTHCSTVPGQIQHHRSSREAASPKDTGRERERWGETISPYFLRILLHTHPGAWHTPGTDRSYVVELRLSWEADKVPAGVLLPPYSLCCCRDAVPFVPRLAFPKEFKEA